MTSVYDLDFTTADAFAVIQRSIVAHPSLLVAHVQHSANAHADYARRTYDRAMYEMAIRLAKESAMVARKINSGRNLEAARICDTFHKVVETFNVACRLQCVSQSLRDEIISRTKMPV